MDRLRQERRENRPLYLNGNQLLVKHWLYFTCLKSYSEFWTSAVRCNKWIQTILFKFKNVAINFACKWTNCNNTFHASPTHADSNYWFWAKYEIPSFEVLIQYIDYLFSNTLKVKVDFVPITLGSKLLSHTLIMSTL